MMTPRTIVSHYINILIRLLLPALQLILIGIRVDVADGKGPAGRAVLHYSKASDTLPDTQPPTIPRILNETFLEVNPPSAPLSSYCELTPRFSSL